MDVYRRDYDSFNYYQSERNSTYEQATTGFQMRAGLSQLPVRLFTVSRFGLIIQFEQWGACLDLRAAFDMKNAQFTCRRRSDIHEFTFHIPLKNVLIRPLASKRDHCAD